MIFTVFTGIIEFNSVMTVMKETARNGARRDRNEGKRTVADEHTMVPVMIILVVLLLYIDFVPLWGSDYVGSASGRPGKKPIYVFYKNRGI